MSGLSAPPGIPTTILRHFAMSNTMRAPLFLRAAALKLQTMTPVRLTDSGDEADDMGEKFEVKHAKAFIGIMREKHSLTMFTAVGQHDAPKLQPCFFLLLCLKGVFTVRLPLVRLAWAQERRGMSVTEWCDRIRVLYNLEKLKA